MLKTRPIYPSFLFFLLILNLSGSLAFGQTGGYTFKGFILDATTKQPVAGVHVIDRDKKTGTTSDSTGHFSIAIQGFPARVSFQHVSYFPDSLNIRSTREYLERYTKSEQIIFLRTNVFLIHEVTVSSGARKLFEKEPVAIMDYQVLDTRIVALGFRNYNEFRKEVLVADLNGKIIWNESRPKIREIYRDCLGDIYLVEEDSVFKIRVENDRIIHTDSCRIRFFMNFIRHVEAITGSATVLSAASELRQYKEYLLMTGPDNGIKPLYRVGDKKNEEKLGINRYISKECEKTIRTSFMTIQQAKETRDRLFQFELGNRYEGMFTNKPVYAALYGVDDSLLLFDFNTCSIVKFTPDGVKTGETPMQIIFGDDWESRLHRDPVTGRFYLEFLNGQSTYLIEVDPATGEEVRKIPVRNYKHIDHVSVLNNRVFFLYQADFGDRGKKLFSIDI